MSALARLLDAVGFIDQTIYANEGNPAPSTWTNGEVIELLRMVRDRLVTLTQPHELVQLDQDESGNPIWGHVERTEPRDSGL